jgi:hypothetical protein
VDHDVIYCFGALASGLPMPDDPEFAAAYQAQLKAISETDSLPGPVSYLHGSLGWAIIRFLESDKWKNRAPDTRRNQRLILDHLRKIYGPGLLIHLDHRTIKGMHRQMAKAFSTSTADIALGLLSTVWKYADRFLDVDLNSNPTRDVARVYESTKEHEPWPTDVIEAFDKAAPPIIRLARVLLIARASVDMIWFVWIGRASTVNGSKSSTNRRVAAISRSPAIRPCWSSWCDQEAKRRDRQRSRAALYG